MRITVTKEMFLDSYGRLKERTSLDLNYLLLATVSAIICAFGFKIDSESVIIGAMVISPLLYPAVCLGAATSFREWRVSMHAAGTFGAGCVAGTVAAIFINLLYTTPFRSAIISRLASSSGDYVLIALFSGMAGAYTFFSSRLHEAIAGVAISVALVPPVVMVGIGIAERDPGLTVSSARITLYNVCGIYAGSLMMIVGMRAIIWLQSKAAH